MAKLVINGKEHGVHAFLVQLRSLDDHTLIPGLETGDIGKKLGFDAVDNGFLIFKNMRIPRFNMLMRFAHVTPDGQFKRTGNELLMYSGTDQMNCFLLIKAKTFTMLFFSKLCF
jgi:alkylation response protein AidB-like acyl-CoA dehydrogenase